MTDNLQQLFIEDLREIYDAEQQAMKAIPKMSSAASAPEVKKAFDDHAEQTRKQIERIEQIFQKMGEQPDTKACSGMQGIVTETEEHIAEQARPDIMDALLIAAEQKAEHYEIAAYTAAQELAEGMGNRDAARRLRQNLAEEERMSRKLTQLSTRLLKKTIREEQRAAA